MIFGITKYSPLDIDIFLSEVERTLDPEQTSDVLYSFSELKSSKSKVSVIFNSKEYCENRPNIVILDSKSEKIEKIAEKIKKAIK